MHRERIIVNFLRRVLLGVRSRHARRYDNSRTRHAFDAPTPHTDHDANMPTTILNVRLIDDDGQRFIAWNTENPSAALNAKNLDELIAGLSGLRVQIEPPGLTAEPAANEPAEAKLDPQWWIGPETFVGGAMLKIRHPGLGCLAFAVPLEYLRKLQRDWATSSGGQKNAPPDKIQTDLGNRDHRMLLCINVVLTIATGSEACELIMRPTSVFACRRNRQRQIDPCNLVTIRICD